MHLEAISQLQPELEEGWRIVGHLFPFSLRNQQMGRGGGSEFTPPQKRDDPAAAGPAGQIPQMPDSCSDGSWL